MISARSKLLPYFLSQDFQGYSSVWRKAIGGLYFPCGMAELCLAHNRSITAEICRYYHKESQTPDDRQAEVLHCTQETMDSLWSRWPNDGDVNGVTGALSVGCQKCPQSYSCKFHPWWFCVHGKAAGTSLLCNMLTLVGHTAQTRKGQSCVPPCLTQPPGMQSTPDYTKCHEEEHLHLKTCSFFSFQIPGFSCQPNRVCLLTPLTHLCFHNHGRLCPRRNLDCFPHCLMGNLMLNPCSLSNWVSWLKYS